MRRNPSNSGSRTLRLDVGQVVLPATPGGSPAAGQWQVNVPLTRNIDLPYNSLASADSVTNRAACEFTESRLSPPAYPG